MYYRSSFKITTLFKFAIFRLQTSYIRSGNIDLLMKKTIVTAFLIFVVFTGLLAQNQEAIEAYNEGITQFNNKDFKAAIASFDKAIALDSSFARAYFNRAVCKADTKDYPGAIADFTSEIAKDTVRNDRAYYGRAQAYYLNNNKELALVDYIESGKINPANSDAMYFAGGILFEVGKYTEAVEQFTMAISSRSDYAEAYHDRASAKQKLGDNAGAISDYGEATKLRPNLVTAYNNLGTLLRTSGQMQEALVEFGYAIKADPTQSTAYVKRGRLKYEMKDFDGSMADFDKAIELDSKDPFAYNNRGCLKNTLRDFKGAVTDFDMAIKIDPTFGYAYMNRGISKENLRDTKGACKDWNEATLNGVEVAKQFIDADCN